MDKNPTKDTFLKFKVKIKYSIPHFIMFNSLFDQPWADLYIHKKPPDPTTTTDPTRPTDRDKLLQSYISAKNKDNDMKLSGYEPWGLPRSSMLPRMTLSSKSPIRNPQRPPSTPLLDTLLIEISTRNFQGIFLGVKKYNS